MKYEYFVASRWRNRDNVLELVKKLRNKGKTVYSFFESSNVLRHINNDPEDYMRDFEKLDWEKDQYVKEIFINDMEAEKESHNFIMLLPAGKSAHIEAGVAYGLGRKCILIGEQKEAESLYRIFSECYPTIDDFITSL